jgi:hypothetical protein
LDIGVFFGFSPSFSAGIGILNLFVWFAIIAFYSIGIGYWLFFWVAFLKDIGYCFFGSSAGLLFYIYSFLFYLK